MKIVIFSYWQDSFLLYIFNFQEILFEVDCPDILFFSFNWQIKIIEDY